MPASSSVPWSVTALLLSHLRGGLRHAEQLHHSLLAQQILPRVVRPGAARQLLNVALRRPAVLAQPHHLLRRPLDKHHARLVAVAVALLAKSYSNSSTELLAVASRSPYALGDHHVVRNLGLHVLDAHDVLELVLRVASASSAPSRLPSAPCACGWPRHRG